MAYIEWWNRTGPSTLGERFGLNEISTRAKTLSPTKSYVDGGRIDMKPGGIVEPGVEHYAVLTDAEKAANVKAWEKNTGLKFKDIEDKHKSNKIKSGKTKGTAATAALQGSLEKSVWLKDYTYDALLKDLQAGKTKSQIANELYEKKPEFFEKLRKTRGVRDNALNTMRTALFDRLIKKPELLKLHNLNEKNFLAKEKLALKEVKNFVKKNQEAYKKVYASNKIGAVTNFKEKVLDFISKKYPELITRSEGTVNLLAGQRLFTPYRLLGREVTQQGRYGLDIALNKEIRKALNIPERPLAGEGLTTDRLHRNYNKNLTKLIKIARDKNIIPKWIKTETQYANYIQKTQIDPIRNLFGKRFNFGQEHLGGVSRAVLVNDAESLAKVTAMDPVVNRYVKGVGYDTRIANLVRLAKQSSGDQAKLYKDSANKLIAEADKKFGLDQTKLKIVKDELKAIQPKAALEDSLYKKAQRALKTFVATKRFKDPNFKLLPEELKKAINFLKEGNVLKSNAFLKAAIKRGGAASVILLGTGMALNTLTDSAEAQTLEPSDKTQEASVLPAVIKDHPYLSSAAAVTAAAPKKVWEGVKWAGEKLIPIMTPAASHVLHGGKYDLTSGQDLTSMAFWKHATDAMKAKSRWGNKQVGLIKRLRDIAWRGGLPTRFLPLISGTASAAMGPMLIKDAAEWLQGRLEKDNLTGKGGIADYAGIISDEAGGSLFIEDVVEEKKRKDAEGMDYAQGGIASLIK